MLSSGNSTSPNGSGRKKQHFACIRAGEHTTFLHAFSGLISAWEKLVARCQPSEKKQTRKQNFAGCFSADEASTRFLLVSYNSYICSLRLPHTEQRLVADELFGGRSAKCLDSAHRWLLNVLAVSVNTGEISAFEELTVFLQLGGKSVLKNQHVERKK